MLVGEAVAMRIVSGPRFQPPARRRRRPASRTSRMLLGGPPRILLLPGGPAVPLEPTAARALALDALEVLRGLHRRSRRPEIWSERRFARQVDHVRTQLTPIRSRSALADSFGREAFRSAHHEPDEGILVAPGPVRVAYAISWLELGDGRPRPDWATWLATAEWEALAEPASI